MARHPIMNRKAPSVLRIPDLMGGLNTRDSLSMINDNQLTDSLNMWWKDGVLKTRPGVKCVKSTYTEGEDNTPFTKWYDIKRHNCYKANFVGKVQLCSSISSGYYENEYTDKVWINFFWCGGEYFQKLSSIYLTCNDTVEYFVVQSESDLYCFLSNQTIYKLTDGAGNWNIVPEHEYYVPTVITNCKFIEDGGTHPQTMDVVANGVMFEGYNILCDYYKMQYSMYNSEFAIQGDYDPAPQHLMYYGLMNDVFEDDRYVGKIVKAEITEADGSVTTHSVTITAHGGDYTVMDIEKTANVKDNKKMAVSGNTIIFYDENGTNISNVFYGDYPDNNLVITAPYTPSNKEEQLDRIFKMSRCEWFGGGAEGLAAGTRLFLCGNSVAKDKALVIWSGLNNPLYFSENAYFYVGDTSSEVTGFGKQADMLVIFKPNETWYTQYTRNTNITASDLIEQRVVDYSASSVYFPLVQINPNIGCPYPDTVQLCRNRLVWLSEGGEVYSLVSNNQYSERSIYPVSEMVKQQLKGERMSLVSSCDLNGYYCLNFGSKVYLMDYNSYGYQYISSYSKNEDANLRIPWYYWELPIVSGDYAILLSLYDSMTFARYSKLGAGTTGVIETFCVDEKMLYDSTFDAKENSITSSFTTKLFDFSLPAYKKNLQLVNISLGNNGGEPIRVEFITDQGTEEKEIVLESDETENRTAGYITNKALHPCIKGVARFGVKLTCEGNMAADGMSFNYIVLGGIR